VTESNSWTNTNGICRKTRPAETVSFAPPPQLALVGAYLNWRAMGPNRKLRRYSSIILSVRMGASPRSQRCDLRRFRRAYRISYGARFRPVKARDHRDREWVATRVLKLFSPTATEMVSVQKARRTTLYTFFLADYEICRKLRIVLLLSFLRVATTEHLQRRH
jgi:hypothetical protein